MTAFGQTLKGLTDGESVVKYRQKVMREAITKRRTRTRPAVHRMLIRSAIPAKRTAWKLSERAVDMFQGMSAFRTRIVLITLEYLRCWNEVVGLKVRYIGRDMVAIKTGKVYDVISIEKGWYRIMTELDDDYLVPPEAFEIVEEQTEENA